MSESSFETFHSAPTPSIRELLHETASPDSTMQIQSMQTNRRQGYTHQPQSYSPTPSHYIPKETICKNREASPCTQPDTCSSTNSCPPSNPCAPTKSCTPTNPCNPVNPCATSDGCGPADPCRKPECCPPKKEEVCVAYQAALPYPLVKPQCKHPQYAAAMLDNLAGQFSEMSAVGFYFYSRLITSEYKEIADTFHHINMVEMHHLEIFGELARQLGENPRLWSRRGRGGSYQYWSPAFLKYPPFPLPAPACDSPCEPHSNQAVKQLLMLAIDSEKEAIRKYMQQTTWIQDINVCDNLRRIAADEELHLEILTRLYHKL